MGECSGDVVSPGGSEWVREALPKEVTFELRGRGWGMGEVAGVRDRRTASNLEEVEEMRYWGSWIRPRGPWRWGTPKTLGAG